MEAVIRKGRIIEIPEIFMKKFGLKVGEKVSFNEKDYSLEITPVKIKAVELENIVDKISGKLRLKQEIIDELVENEEAYNSEVF